MKIFSTILFFLSFILIGEASSLVAFDKEKKKKKKKGDDKEQISLPDKAAQQKMERLFMDAEKFPLVNHNIKKSIYCAILKIRH